MSRSKFQVKDTTSYPQHFTLNKNTYVGTRWHHLVLPCPRGERCTPGDTPHSRPLQYYAHTDTPADRPRW